MNLSDNLKRIRKDNNLSQEQLAEKLGVSRQAVSKWESGQSYPEMDKVLLICKLFNYGIDELMNENVREVDENKQAKNNISKYIDDFFGFITKTVDMLSSMKFKDKLKCLVEQIFIIFFLLIIFSIIEGIGSNIIFGIIGEFSNNNVFYVIRGILEGIYTILALIIGIAVLLHIFKVRYLDYFEVVKEDNIQKNNNENNENEVNNEEKKIILEKKKEKIVIRDPEHSQSKFLTGIINIVLWCIKFMVACILLGFAISFVVLMVLLILSFMFVKTGLVFIGAFLGILSALAINFVILEVLFNFIISKTNKKRKIAIILISSLVLAGASIGLILIGVTEFNYSKTTVNEIEDVYEVKMSDNLSINNWFGNTEYTETDSNNIKIVVAHSKYCISNFDNYNEEIRVWCEMDNSMFMESIREIIKDINNKEIKDYSYDSYKIYVYTSKENIEKIKANTKAKYEEIEQTEIDNLQDEIYELENKVYELEDDNLEKDYLIEELQGELEEKQNELNVLREEDY